MTVAEARITKTIHAFRSVVTELCEPDKPIEEIVNQGYCFALAYAVKMESRLYGFECDIIRVRGHWFIRHRTKTHWVYYDVCFPEGASLSDIVDAAPNEAEVWTTDDVLKYLDFVGVTEIYRHVGNKLRGTEIPNVKPYEPFSFEFW